jgi:hypothetical protein
MTAWLKLRNPTCIYNPPMGIPQKERKKERNKEKNGQVLKLKEKAFFFSSYFRCLNPK